MSIRNCPSPGSWLRRVASPGLTRWAVGGLVWAVSGTAFAQADKGVIGDREDRIQGAQSQQAVQKQAEVEPWSPAKIIINLDARCPVVTALGYFGAFATADKDPAKAAELQARYAELQKVVQPMADVLKKMAADTTFAGRSFPEALVPKLQVMCGTLYAEITKLYGDAGLGELKQYLATQAQAVVVK